MTRADAAATVGAEFASLLADAGMAATDDAGNLKEPLDSALRSLGTAEADLATGEADDDDAEGFLTLARYWTLARIVAALASNFNLSSGGTSLSLQQQFANAKSLMEFWQGIAESIYGSVTGGGVGGTQWLDLGYLELNDEDYAGQYASAGA